MIVDLKSKNAELQKQLDMLLSADDADLYDVDVNRDFRLIPLLFLKTSLFKQQDRMNDVLDED